MDEKKAKRLYLCIWIAIFVAISIIPGWSLYSLTRECCNHCTYSNREAGKLVKELSDENVMIRRAAIIKLGKLGENAAFAVPELILRLYDEDKTNRLYSVMTLGMIGPEARAAVPALKNVTTLVDEKHLLEILKTMAKIGSENDYILSFIQPAIYSNNVTLQRNALSVLKLSETLDNDTISTLVGYLLNDSEIVSKSAAEVLMKNRSSAIPVIDGKLENADIGTCLKMADALGRIGLEVYPYLKETLQSGEKYKNWTAALGICRNGWEMEIAAPVLTDFLDDDNSTVASVSAQALSSIGIKALPAILEKLDNNDSSRTFEQVSGIINNIIPDGNTRPYIYKPAPEETDSSESPDNIADLHFDIENDNRLELLSAALDDPDVQIRLNAVCCLGNFNSNAEEVLILLGKALHDNNPRVRWKATVSLGTLAAKRNEFKPEFIEALKTAYNCIEREDENRYAESTRYISITNFN